MDTPYSERTHVESELVHKSPKDNGVFSAATSVAPSLYEKGGAVSVSEPVEELDIPPDGGRGWLVVLGCVIYSAATVGWGYVLALVCARWSRD